MQELAQWAMRRLTQRKGVVATVLLIGLASLCSVWDSHTRRVVVTQAEYGVDWPFIVPEVLLECRGDSNLPQVVASLTEHSRDMVDTGGRSSFAVNDTPKSDASLAPLELIWRHAPKTVAVGDWVQLRVSIAPILERGIRLCEGLDYRGPDQLRVAVGQPITYGAWIGAASWIAERQADRVTQARDLEQLGIEPGLLGDRPEWPFAQPRIYLGCRGDTQAVTASLTESGGSPGSETYALNGPATRLHPSVERILKSNVLEAIRSSGASEVREYVSFLSLVERGLELCDAGPLIAKLQANDQWVRREQYGGNWPFTFSEGHVECAGATPVLRIPALGTFTLTGERAGDFAPLSPELIRTAPHSGDALSFEKLAKAAEIECRAAAEERARGA